MRNFARPAIKKDARAFLGLTGYYRQRTVCSHLSVSLRTDKSSTATKVNWAEHEKAFQTMKHPSSEKSRLQEEILLADFERGIGAMLSQQDREGIEHPIA